MTLIKLGKPVIRNVESAVTCEVLGRLVGVVLPFVLGGILGVAERPLAERFQDRVLSPLLRVLADDERIRQRSLAVGAVLFVVGFLLQLIATF